MQTRPSAGEHTVADSRLHIKNIAHIDNNNLEKCETLAPDSLSSSSFDLGLGLKFTEGYSIMPAKERRKVRGQKQKAVRLLEEYRNTALR